MSFAFFLVFLSALFHALWNMGVKLSKNKVISNLHMQIVSAIVIILLMVIFKPEEIRLDKATIFYAAISSFFFALYQYFTAVAYRYGDVSLVYPISTSSPLFIIIWAYLLLGERISLMGFVGILLILIGGYIINVTKGKHKASFYGILLALLAAFFYSFGALADKLGVGGISPNLYIMYTVLFIALYSLIINTIIGLKTHTLIEKVRYKPEWKVIIPFGIIMAASVASFRIGLVEVPVSYASALRQVSSLFGVIMGIIFLKEAYGWKRIVGSIIIILGIILIKLGI